MSETADDDEEEADDQQERIKRVSIASRRLSNMARSWGNSIDSGRIRLMFHTILNFLIQLLSGGVRQIEVPIQIFWCKHCSTKTARYIPEVILQ